MAELTEDRSHGAHVEAVRARHVIARREDTMYLQTLGGPCGRFIKPVHIRDPCSLQPSDGYTNSKPIFHTEHRFNLRTDDINLKAAAREPAPKQFHSLYNDDLPQSKTQGLKFKTNRPPTNPLAPEYPGNNEVRLEPVETRFLKDPLNLDDIDGAQSHWRSKVKKTKLQSRVGHQADYAPIVTCKLQEIVFRSEPTGTEPPAFRRLQARAASTQQGPKPSTLDVHDIAKAKAYQLSKRCVDPLNPTYFFYDIQRQPNFLEPIKKSKSSVRHPTTNKADFTLETADIEGARPNTNQFLYVNGHERRTFNATNDLSNIDKVAPGSHKKSIRTKRCTNPLDRNYSFPEGFQEGFSIGTEYKNSKGLSEYKHTGKRIIDRESTLRPKNWDLINHRAKDPNIKENFRSQGKMIDPKWIRESNDIFLLDSPNEVNDINTKALRRILPRDPVKGDGVEYVVLKATVPNDENFPPNRDLWKSSKAKVDSDGTGAVGFGARTQPQAFRLQTRTRHTKSPPTHDFDSRVTFKPLQTTEQQFEAFISKEHRI